VCTAQSRWGTLCVLHSLERHCVCTAQSRWGTLCVLHSLERHCVCTAQRDMKITILEFFGYFLTISISPLRTSPTSIEFN